MTTADAAALAKTPRPPRKTAPARGTPKPAAPRTRGTATAVKKPPARKATPAAAPVAAAAPVSPPKKRRWVQDKLKFPRDEYGVIALLKVRLGTLGHAAKKTDIVRAGLQAVAALSDQALLQAIRSLPGHPKGKSKGKDQKKKKAP